LQAISAPTASATTPPVTHRRSDRQSARDTRITISPHAGDTRTAGPAPRAAGGRRARALTCAYACAGPGATAYLLGWNIIEDDRPLRNENAAFVVEHASTAGAPKWTVVVMYRRAFNPWWNIATGPHSRVVPLRDFPSRPTPADVEAVLDDTGWSYTDRGGFKLLAGNMIDENWQLALGGKPTRLHRDGIEQ
jgi:hypothetical protein